MDTTNRADKAGAAHHEETEPVRALFGFLRLKRDQLFDEAFQGQLEEMYRQTGAGDPPHPPAMMCMVLLLHGYIGASDVR